MTPLERQLRRHEGEKLELYRCPAGYLTIGIGHNIEAHGITPDVSRLIFKIDLARAKNDLDMLLDYYRIRKWEISSNRYDVLVNMSFCMGRASLGGFKKMFAAIQQNDWPAAAVEILDSDFGRSKYHRVRAVELANQMETGEYGEK
jgi:lysozyme